jgi:2-dehydro-3-deoxyphosphooctonate aldolase (KDO 8-P synthase)
MLKNIEYIRYTDSGNFFLLAGPCVVESREICFDIAKRIIEITEKLEIPYIFKASYRKANRSRLDSFSGIGDEQALEILQDIRQTLKVPIVSDIHNPDEAEIAANLQIPTRADLQSVRQH